MAKKFRRLAERHGLESMTAASNRLRAHLHAVVSRGVQEGVTRVPSIQKDRRRLDGEYMIDW